jgi:glycosyltransferase involved in cell wall biosynthesis
LWAPIWSRIAANVIVPNEAMAEEFARRYRRTPVIVRNPVSPDGMPSPRPWPMIPNQYKIVYTGSVYHAVSDSLVNLIAALAELDNYSLHIYTSQSDDQLAAYGVHGPKVFRHEHVDQTTCYEEQRSADVLFLPLAFHSEIQGVLRTSAPMKMGEYLTSGRPILVHAPADTFIVQHIRQHRAGVVVDIAEPRALADALHEITSNPELRESMRENSLRLAESYDVRRAQEVFWGTVKASMTLEHS